MENKKIRNNKIKRKFLKYTNLKKTSKFQKKNY